MIQSVKNPQVKQWKKLLTKKERDKTGTFLIEGFHLVEEALKKREQVLEIIVSEKIELPPRLDFGSVPVTSVTDEISKELSDTEAPQGIYAICHQGPDVDSKVQEAKSFLLIDAVQDPGNMGTMIRTPDSRGFYVIIGRKRSFYLFHLKVLPLAPGKSFSPSNVSRNLQEW